MLNNTNAGPSLDQSNTDLNMRVHCLSLACGLAQAPSGDTELVVNNARDFYLFLTSQDPIVDMKVTEAYNVVSIEEYRKGIHVPEVNTDVTH